MIPKEWEELLSVEHVAVRFGGLTAIADMTFKVRKGELVSLIGPNGAGKTTAFNVVSGYLAPAAGSVAFAGRSTRGLKTHEIAALGLVRTFQRTSLFTGASALESVMRALHKQGSSSTWAVLLGLPSVRREEKWLRDKAREILAFVGLADRLDHKSTSLPYGEQRLLGVAMALATEPTLLLLDEPVSGMNPTETLSFMRILDRIRQRGITVLLVEHDMRMVMEVSDRVLVLYQGHIIANDVPSVIQRNPEVIRAYLGDGRHRAGH
ncbi:ABC transporter ATP-binding protein [Mesorhizobium sp. CO1-1-8]|uniref:ABC transporter ATP-binding protein n=1 Tax=Mesorhizobium sp. CO1-1-8 TaxID=2876631 RepID=UPI001CD1178D|nr:ABC transporter ATP-binding protein [Mesorhizobium sp. CO1-1-8]MBZ9772412.1 ABC transporter ATP-binding protein [Mesorhizobium sp. CO1-1-8]